jgi:Cdc6-like AAA superfamily ATPase
MATLTLTMELTNHKKREFLRTFVFGGDDRVTEALAMLESLVSQFVHVQVAVIGQDLSAAARSIRALDGKIEDVIKSERKIFSSLGRREERDKDRDMREKLRKWLCIDEKDTWREYHNTISPQRAKDTGTWLYKKNGLFTQWCDTETEANNIMVITSGRGRGKSFLASAVIDHLKSLESASESRTLVAYSYYQATAREEPRSLSQKGSKKIGQGTTAASRALCNIVWQLAELDQDYRVFAHRICEDDDCKMGAIDIWDKLIMDYSPPGRFNIFIVLDGVQLADQGLLEKMMHGVPGRTSQLRLRVFVTANPEAVAKIGGIKALIKIPLNPTDYLEDFVPNIDDVMAIAKDQLVKMPIFSHENSSTQGTQQEVLDVLMRQCQNDFEHLSLVLNEIDQCLDLRQVGKILQRIDEPHGVKLGRQIRSLNSKLTSGQIKEVNALISCLENFKISGSRRPGVPCSLAEQYVDVKLNIPRVISLSERVNQHYSLLFEVDALDRIRWRYTKIQKYLKKDFEDQQTLKEIYERRGKQPSNTDLEEMNLLELIIQNNFKTVFGAPRGGELFDRYGLGEYFMSQRGQHTELICANEKKNRYSVLFICLQVLCEDISLRPVDELRSYARENLWEHLRWDPKHKLEPEENQAIGRFLVTLLRNNTVIDQWSQESSSGIIKCFPYDPEKDDPTWKWFKAVGNFEGLKELEYKEWFRKLGSKPNHWDYAIERIVDGWYKQERSTWNTIQLLAPGWQPVS